MAISFKKIRSSYGSLPFKFYVKKNWREPIINFLCICKFIFNIIWKIIMLFVGKNLYAFSCHLNHYLSNYQWSDKLLIYSSFNISHFTNRYGFCLYWDSLVAQMVKNLTVIWETRVRGNGYTHSHILAWKNPRQRSLEGNSLWCHQESDTTE